MKYILNGVYYRRYENGLLVEYKDGETVDLSDEEAGRFAPGRILNVIMDEWKNKRSRRTHTLTTIVENKSAEDPTESESNASHVDN